MADKFYSTGEAAKAAGISRQTLQEWISAGKVEPPKMVGNTRVWSQSQVNKLKLIPRKEK